MKTSENYRFTDVLRKWERNNGPILVESKFQTLLLKWFVVGFDHIFDLYVMQLFLH